MLLKITLTIKANLKKADTKIRKALIDATVWFWRSETQLWFKMSVRTSFLPLYFTTFFSAFISTIAT